MKLPDDHRKVLPGIEQDTGLRIARTHTGGLVPDPTQFDGTQLVLGCNEARTDPHRARARAEAVLDNRGRIAQSEAWQVPRRTHPAWIIGAGPSAQEFPPGAFGLTIAVNSGLWAIGRRPDYWILADPLDPCEGVDAHKWAVRAQAAEELGTKCLLAHWASPMVAQALKAPIWWAPAFGGPYGAPLEDLLEPAIGAQLLRLCLLLSGVSAAIHLAWLMGCKLIRTIGIDQSRAINGIWYPADPERTGVLGGDIEIDTRHGRRLTSRASIAVRDQIDAMIFWLGKAGCKVYDHSRGLPLYWALDPE